ALAARRQSHLVINLRIVGVARNRLLECIQSRRVLTVSVMPKSKHPVSTGVVEIHAECGARLRNCAVTVFGLIKEEGKAVVRFRKGWVGFFGTTVFVEGSVPVALTLLDVAPQEMESVVARMIVHQGI